MVAVAYLWKDVELVKTKWREKKKSYVLKPFSVVINDRVKLLLVFFVYCDNVIEAKRSDIISAQNEDSVGPLI